MRFKVDTEGVLLVVGGVEPVIDRETSQPRLDPDSGRPLFLLHLMAAEAGVAKPVQWSVRISGEPPAGVGLGVLVRLREVVANFWEMGDRHGVSMRAGVVEVVRIPAETKAG